MAQPTPADTAAILQHARAAFGHVLAIAELFKNGFDEARNGVVDVGPATWVEVDAKRGELMAELQALREWVIAPSDSMRGLAREVQEAIGVVRKLKRIRDTPGSIVAGDYLEDWPEIRTVAERGFHELTQTERRLANFDEDALIALWNAPLAAKASSETEGASENVAMEKDDVAGRNQLQTIRNALAFLRSDRGSAYFDRDDWEQPFISFTESLAAHPLALQILRERGGYVARATAPGTAYYAARTTGVAYCKSLKPEIFKEWRFVNGIPQERHIKPAALQLCEAMRPRLDWDKQRELADGQRRFVRDLRYELDSIVAFLREEAPESDCDCEAVMVEWKKQAQVILREASRIHADEYCLLLETILCCQHGSDPRILFTVAYMQRETVLGVAQDIIDDLERMATQKGRTAEVIAQLQTDRILADCESAKAGDREAAHRLAVQGIGVEGAPAREPFSVPVVDHLGMRTVVVPPNEVDLMQPIWTADDMAGFLLDLEAETNTRLKDGGNPLWLMRLRDDFRQRRDESSGVSFPEFCRRRYSELVDFAPFDLKALRPGKSGLGTVKRRRGGKQVYNPTDDAKVAEAWSTGRHGTYYDLAKSLGSDWTFSKVKAAIDRDRKRRDKKHPLTE